MKRKAEFGDWGGMADFHSKIVRPNPDEISRVLSERNLNQLRLRDFSCDYQTPMKQANVNVMTSTPFSNHTPRRSTSFQPERNDVMDSDADVELRRIVDNFVSIYEQLDKCGGVDVKPNYSYTELAYLAMLRSPNFCLPITEIYRYIQSRFLFFKNSTRKHWKNAVRHSLAKTMCFTKIPIGRGTSNSENLSRSTYLWCIIPTSIGHFARGDYRPSVDKESGTNTLRWGYMRVNAGQFWDQVGKYIANRMANFRQFLQDTPTPGSIFEEQVCRVPGLNLTHGTMAAEQPNFRVPVDDRQFMTGYYGDRTGFNNSFDMLGVCGGAGRNSHVALPAKGMLSDLPIREYVNAPLLETTNNLYHRNDHNTQNRASENMTLAHFQTGDNLATPEVSTPSYCSRFDPAFTMTTPNPEKMTPPTIINPPIAERLTTQCKMSPPIPGDLTPPPAITRFHRSTPTQTSCDKNDSGFESCGSTPEVEQRACPMSGQPIKQYTEKFSVNSCDIFDEGIQLDFSHLNHSGFPEPEFSEFCDSLLDNPTGGLLESPNYRKQETMNSNCRSNTPNYLNKENMPAWLNGLPSNENPFSFRRVTPQKESIHHGDLDPIVSVSLSDGQSLFGNTLEPTFPWTFQKVLF